MTATTLALLGATGGAGTTRTSLELATILAADGADVAVLDVAYDTQGLARHLSGTLSPDLTSLVTDETDRPLADGLVAFDPMGGDVAVLDAAGGDPDASPAVDDDPTTSADAESNPEPAPPDPGRIACCPAHAPFERLARAKTVDAARSLERRVEEAGESFDYVFVDTPPLGSNPAVAAVTTADRVAVVSPATAHGLDAVQAARGRLQDVGTAADAVVGVDRRARPREGVNVDSTDVDALVPVLPGDAPACLGSAESLTALADVAAATVDREVSLQVAERSVLDRVNSLR